MLKLIRLPEAKKGKDIWQDANDTLSSFPFARQDRREPTKKEMKTRSLKNK